MPAGSSGLLEGNAQQVVIQLYGIGVTIVWSGVATWILLKLIGLMAPLRVTQQHEVEGPRHHPARRGAAIRHDPYPGPDPGRFCANGNQEPGRSGLFLLPPLRNSHRQAVAIAVLNN